MLKHQLRCRQEIWHSPASQIGMPCEGAGGHPAVTIKTQQTSEEFRINISEGSVERSFLPSYFNLLWWVAKFGRTKKTWRRKDLHQIGWFFWYFLFSWRTFWKMTESRSLHASDNDKLIWAFEGNQPPVSENVVWMMIHFTFLVSTQKNCIWVGLSVQELTMSLMVKHLHPKMQ